MSDWRNDCDWCGWPLAATEADGVGCGTTCSQRPLPTLSELGAARQEIRKLEALLAQRTTERDALQLAYDLLAKETIEVKEERDELTARLKRCLRCTQDKDMVQVQCVDCWRITVEGVKQLEQERDAAIKERDNLNKMSHVVIAQLKDHLARLEEAMRKWGRHTKGCLSQEKLSGGMGGVDWSQQQMGCTCGLDQALRKEPDA